ncbi:MAG TPA: hypothetical protein VFV34_16870, partial [Blastocatellia bacterium]|nr:hypothetical protein [Blastocatellia bacterium]
TKRASSGRLLPMAPITYTVINTSDGGAGSLRDAITSANADGVPSTINFNIPVGDPGFAGGVFTIKPSSPLPVITGGDTLIDGTSQTLFTGDTNPAGPEIVLNGSVQVPINNPGLRIISANNTVRGMVINGMPGPGGDAIRIQGPISTGNAIVGCYIGTDPTGTALVANGGTGIVMILGANTNRVGGTSPGDKNLISGNVFGIRIAGTPTSTAGSNIIQGNFIGTNAAGTAALGNTASGLIINGTDDNLIGGTAAGAGNVMSGNLQQGVHIVGLTFDTNPDPNEETLLVNPATGNIVQGNFLGTNATGTAAIQNGVDGVRLNHGAQGNIIGGTIPAARNVCSGNFAHGVHLDGIRASVVPSTPVQNNVVQGNLMGTDITGTLPIPNQLAGATVFVAQHNLIGGTGSGQGNIIAFNTGGSVPDGQGGSIVVPGAGVTVATLPEVPDADLGLDPTVGNRISGNSIHSNTGVITGDGLGIDLNKSPNEVDAQDGVTPNDAGDGDTGANDLQNFPVLASVATSGAVTTIQGTLNSTPNATFTIEFFSNSDCDPTGFGEGETYIGSTTVATNGAGNGSFSASFAAVGCLSVTATATDPDGNTSEFSNCINEAPSVSCGVATTTLWPANHNLVNVGLAVSASDNCPNPVVSVQVFSDEDDEEPTGDGNHSPDAKNIAAGTLRLRSERKGDGDGRVYLIIVSATDSSGNTTRCCSTVTVSHSQSNADKASVAAQAAAASAYCAQFGTPPPGYVLVGDGPVIGPKQ